MMRILIFVIINLFSSSIVFNKFLAACPVLCSGNGVFSNGGCICHEGFKGQECEISSNTCVQPNCNGNGRCMPYGQCECYQSWTGEFCEEAACFQTCTLHGICVKGRCYCESGWFGDSCEFEINSAKSSIKNVSLTSLKINNLYSKNFSSLINDKSSKTESNFNNRHLLTNTTTNYICQENCLNGGKCVAGVCKCLPNWNGWNCSVRAESEVSLNPENVEAFPVCLYGCEQHGICQQDGRCKCSKGWSGENCFIGK